MDGHTVPAGAAAAAVSITMQRQASHPHHIGCSSRSVECPNKTQGESCQAQQAAPYLSTPISVGARKVKPWRTSR